MSLYQEEVRRIDDPTAIPWEGVAWQGDTPFSCKLISPIEGTLWMGGCIDGLSLPPDFEYVVSLYPWEKYRLGPDTERFEFALYDAELDSPGEILDIATRAVNCLMKGKTLIHCQAGLNRSGLIAALAIYQMGKCSMDAAIALLREKRTPAVLCNPHFEEFLRSL